MGTCILLGIRFTTLSREESDWEEMGGCVSSLVHFSSFPLQFECFPCSITARKPASRTGNHHSCRSCQQRLCLFRHDCVCWQCVITFYQKSWQSFLVNPWWQHDIRRTETWDEFTTASQKCWNVWGFMRLVNSPSTFDRETFSYIIEFQDSF